ncbi:LamG-like jellyroll fold domain-containing protein [Halorientalis regularis]|nr:LamG-like jellyroll fold domain-containing protein [Halorientalis regularis]
MKRRNILMGLGGLAGVGGVVGTGAFTSVSADRTVSVAVADDDQAFLQLQPSNTIYGDKFASQNSNGLLELDFGSNGRGDGLGTDSVYEFDDVFTVTNQGTQPVYVWATFDTSNFGNGSIWLYPGSDDGTKLTNGDDSVVELAVGETVHMGVHIDTHGVDLGTATVQGTIHANATKPADSDAPENPDGGPYAPTAPEDYVAYYPLDGDANDASGNGLNGTVNGAQSATGVEAQALSFDGNDDYVKIPDDPILDITEALTLAAWVKPASDQNDYARIVSREQSGAGNRQYNLGIDANAEDPRTVVDTVSTDGVEVSGIIPITDDQWHHVAMTFDATSEVCLYVDGIEVDDAAVSAQLVSRDSPVTIGAPAHLPDKDYFTGRIDDVQIFDRALSATEVDAIYSAAD